MDELMKPFKLLTCFTAVVAIAFATGPVLKSSAQQPWNPDYSTSCDERGNCRYGNETVNYRQSYGYGNERYPTGIPHRASFRVPYQGSAYSNGIGFGGTCGQPRADQYRPFAADLNSADWCPFNQRQFEYSNSNPQSTYGGQTPFRGRYEGNQNFDARQNGPAQYRRELDSYEPAPADRRPELRAVPSPDLGEFNRRSNTQQDSIQLTVPPTPTQMMPPPELPPQGIQ